MQVHSRQVIRDRGRDGMKITVLVDNTASAARQDLAAEHGLSLLLQGAGACILFDAGASPRFLDNARLLGLDMAGVEAAVLSHGHYDHGGGLAAFAAANTKARIYVGRGALEQHFLRVAGPFRRSVGVPGPVLAALGGRTEVVSDRTEIAEGVFLLPCGRSPSRTSAFLRKTPAGIMPDDFSHELMLAAVDRGELAVFTGCSHSGIMEMIGVARATFPGMPVRAVIGGLHLTNPATRKLIGTTESVTGIGRTLAEDTEVRKVYSGHCTGDAAFDLLKREMGGKLEKLQTGMRIELFAGNRREGPGQA
jgi:7,8-dihydropterin-6-yl-methyl-4-(beta-D-ribofuranosyl)aminobenzene 5'-phosphate synthase